MVFFASSVHPKSPAATKLKSLMSPDLDLARTFSLVLASTNKSKLVAMINTKDNIKNNGEHLMRKIGRQYVIIINFIASLLEYFV
jgi:hypothetical protein